MSPAETNTRFQRVYGYRAMGGPRSLTDLLAAGLPDAGAIAGKDLDDTIFRRLAEAREAWPGVDVDNYTAIGYVAAHLRDPDDVEASVAAANWVELYLLCACGSGDAVALAAFDEHYLSLVPAAVAHIGLSGADVDELTQRIREKLFVAAGTERPRIDQYAGGGSVHGLIKVMAVRDAISITRKHAREVWNPDDELLRLPSEAGDPELDNAKGELRDHFRAAFEETVGELSARERNLLRMHLIEGVTLENLAQSYSVHRVTITRWLMKARQSLLSGTRRRLQERAGTRADELDSFLGLVKSRLDLSLSRILRTER